MTPYFIGTFALITLTLAGAVIGRLLGLSLIEALYIAGLSLALVGYVGARRIK